MNSFKTLEGGFANTYEQISKFKENQNNPAFSFKHSKAKISLERREKQTHFQINIKGKNETEEDLEEIKL